jgi:hypothetical protein
MFDFFSWIFNKLSLAIRANPIGIFIYSIIAKWSVVVIIAGSLIVYSIFSKLKEIGVIDSTFAILVQSLNVSKSIAQNCTPKILNIESFWSCLSDPGEYKPVKGEKTLNNLNDDIQDLMDRNSINKPPKSSNPYDN